MIDDELQARLRSADGDLSRASSRVPRVADLERRHRRRQMVRAGALALVAAVAATAHWSTTWLRVGDYPAGGAAEAIPALAAIEPAMAEFQESLASLQSAIADLRAERARSLPTPAIDQAALTAFRALRPSAAAGDRASLCGIRSIAESHPGTPGGRIARAFLDRCTDPSLNQSEVR